MDGGIDRWGNRQMMRGRRRGNRQMMRAGGGKGRMIDEGGRGRREAGADDSRIWGGRGKVGAQLQLLRVRQSQRACLRC